jgi:hypothetical protein
LLQLLFLFFLIIIITRIKFIIILIIIIFYACFFFQYDFASQLFLDLILLLCLLPPHVPLLPLPLPVFHPLNHVSYVHLFIGHLNVFKVGRATALQIQVLVLWVCDYPFIVPMLLFLWLSHDLRQLKPAMVATLTHPLGV